MPCSVAHTTWRGTLHGTQFKHGGQAKQPHLPGESLSSVPGNSPFSGWGCTGCRPGAFSRPSTGSCGPLCHPLQSVVLCGRTRKYAPVPSRPMGRRTPSPKASHGTSSSQGAAWRPVVSPLFPPSGIEIVMTWEAYCPVPHRVVSRFMPTAHMTDPTRRSFRFMQTRVRLEEEYCTDCGIERPCQPASSMATMPSVNRARSLWSIESSRCETLDSLQPTAFPISRMVIAS